ncbi:hypothetical protein CDAR_101871 [Caerostris darwini]|uniref:Uncharacterized protein n=1 Tax=Caerostris darwini TaxID=1538125 RepID=A0AAV4TFN1_9ARAC|nr:hypothetical protein CDAR_101871 [Caerostris darwini]
MQAILSEKGLHLDQRQLYYFGEWLLEKIKAICSNVSVSILWKSMADSYLTNISLCHLVHRFRLGNTTLEVVGWNTWTSTINVVISIFPRPHFVLVFFHLKYSTSFLSNSCPEIRTFIMVVDSLALFSGNFVLSVLIPDPSFLNQP